MKNTKKWLSLILAVMMVLCSVPVTVGAVSYTGTCGAQGSNLTWEVDPDTATLYIRGTGDMADFGKNYSEFPGWYKYTDKFIYVDIADGVTSIGNYAFYNSIPNVDTVELSKGIKKLGKYSFNPDKHTVTVDSANPYLYINSDGYLLSTDGTILHSIVKSQGSSYVIPEGVTEIKEYAFCYYPDNEYNHSVSCRYSKIYLPASLATIYFDYFFTDIQPRFFVDEENAFFSSDEYGALFNKSKTIIYRGAGAVGNAYHLYEIPESVITIADNAFKKYDEMVDDYSPTIQLTGNVRNIGKDAFTAVYRGGHVYIPLTVSKIDPYFITHGAAYTSIYFEGTQAQWNQIYTNPGINHYIEYNHTTHVYKTETDSYTCATITRCVGCYHTTNIEINHSWYKGDSYIDDCDNGGEIYYYCSRCQKSKTENIAPGSHSWFLEESYQTCTDAVYCYLCNNCNDTKTERIPGGGNHDWYTDDNTTPGYADKTVTYYCWNCEESKTEVIPGSCTHNWEVDEEDFNCEDGGYLSYVCYNCGSYKSETVAPKAHEMEDHPDPSTFCGEREFEVSCKYCDYYTYITVKGTGDNHSYMVYDELPETCTTDGWIDWVCEREGCDYKEHEVVPALGHNYNEKWTVLTVATCSQSGISVRACKRCAEIEAATMPAYGHHDNNGDYKCDDCGCVVEIPESTHENHTFGEWVTAGNLSYRQCTECAHVEIKFVTVGGDVEIEAPEQPDCDFEVDSVMGEDFVLVEEGVSAELGEGWTVLKAFDINLKNSDGVHVQPDGTVKVKLPLDWEKEGNYKVYRVENDGSFTDMNAYQQGSHMVFDTDHFSVYVIVEGSADAPSGPDTPDNNEQPKKEANVFSFLTEFLNNIIDFFKKLFKLN